MRKRTKFIQQQMIIVLFVMKTMHMRIVQEIPSLSSLSKTIHRIVHKIITRIGKTIKISHGQIFMGYNPLEQVVKELTSKSLDISS